MFINLLLYLAPYYYDYEDDDDNDDDNYDDNDDDDDDNNDDDDDDNDVANDDDDDDDNDDDICSLPVLWDRLSVVYCKRIGNDVCSTYKSKRMTPKHKLGLFILRSN